MSSVAKHTMVCARCQKRFVWRAEMAGKRVRCTCGEPLTPPADPSAAQDGPPPLLPVEPAHLYDVHEPEKPKRLPRSSAPVQTFFAPLELEDDGLHCPECDHAMEPGTVVCSKCGFNFRSGQCPPPLARVARPAPTTTPAATPAPTVPPAFPIPDRPARDRYTMESPGPPVRRIVAVVAVLALFLIAVAWHHLAASSAPVFNSGKGEDVQVNEMINDDGAMELHAWFAQDPDRIAGEFSPKQAMAKADELQAMGAVKILAFGSRMTLALAVQLPDKPAQRAALFAWEKHFAEERFYKPDTDVGQHYLLLRLHP